MPDDDTQEHHHRLREFIDVKGMKELYTSELFSFVYYKLLPPMVGSFSSLTLSELNEINRGKCGE